MSTAPTLEFRLRLLLDGVPMDTPDALLPIDAVDYDQAMRRRKAEQEALDLTVDRLRAVGHGPSAGHRLSYRVEVQEHSPWKVVDPSRLEDTPEWPGDLDGPHAWPRADDGAVTPREQPRVPIRHDTLQRPDKCGEPPSVDFGDTWIDPENGDRWEYLLVNVAEERGEWTMTHRGGEALDLPPHVRLNGPATAAG